MKPYIVHAPTPYTGRSGGIRALYQLTAMLRKLGCQAAIGAMAPSPWTPDECPFDVEFSWSWGASQRAEAVHVYPEIIGGNPAHASHIVRWLLGPKRYESDDLEFAFLPIGGERRLAVDIIEPEFFYPKTHNGTGTLYWCGVKGVKGEVPEGAQQITYGWPANRHDMGEALRAADLLISVDPFTAVIGEATICGTPVLIPDGVPQMAEGLDRHGIAHGVGELDWARSTVHLAFERRQEYLAEITSDVYRFIDITQSQFGA